MRQREQGVSPRPVLKDLLPDGHRGRVTVRLDTDADTFLARFAKVLVQREEWSDVRLGAPTMGTVWADYAGPERFHPVLTDMRIGFIAGIRLELNSRLLIVDISSSHYSDLDYATYVRIMQLVKPAISTYNHEYGTRLRLHVPSRESLEPKLPPGACEYLDRALVDEPYKPVEVRLQYYYAFIWYMHSHHIQLAASDIGRILERRGLESWLVTDLEQTYRHGRDIIHMRHKWRAHSRSKCNKAGGGF